ncbi:MAG: chemotaxis protein CheD [Deltaproteobacteria bacterium]
MKTTIPVTSGSYAVSADPSATLVGVSIGAGIAVAVFDPETRTGGLFITHLIRTQKETSASTVHYFGLDTGLPALMKAFMAAGGRRDSLRVHLVGAGEFLDAPPFFRMGEDLRKTARRVLEKNRVLVAGEKVGGPENRCLTLDVGDGSIRVESPGQQEVIM